VEEEMPMKSRHEIAVALAFVGLLLLACEELPESQVSFDAPEQMVGKKVVVEFTKTDYPAYVVVGSQVVYQFVSDMEVFGDGPDTDKETEFWIWVKESESTGTMTLDYGESGSETYEMRFKSKSTGDCNYTAAASDLVITADCVFNLTDVDANVSGSRPGGGTFTFDCDSGAGGSVELGTVCVEEEKRYAKVFGCNLIDDMYDACTDLYSCLNDEPELHCAQYGDLQSTCMLSCVDDDECDAGQRCLDTTDGALCLPFECDSCFESDGSCLSSYDGCRFDYCVPAVCDDSDPEMPTDKADLARCAQAGYWLCEIHDASAAEVECGSMNAPEKCGLCSAWY
jgi:hypothetical protein